MAMPSNPHLINNMFVGFCRHDYITVPPAVPPVWWFLDFDVVNGITGLFAWPTAKYAFPPARRPEHGEILDMSLPMEGRGTDATLVVPHVPVPLALSVLLPLIILFGSSKIIMGSNKTRIWCKGLTGLTGEMEQAVGCCIFPYIPMSLNLQCWDFACKKFDVSIGAPILSDVVFAPNTVQVGISFADYLAAMIDWAIDVLLAVLVAFGTKGVTKAWAKHQASKLEKANKLADAAYERGLMEASEKGLSREASEESAKLARKEAFDEATKSVLPKWLSNFADTPGGKAWLVGLGLKLPWRMLVKNTEWFREDVRQPILRDL